MTLSCSLVHGANRWQISRRALSACESARIVCAQFQLSSLVSRQAASNANCAPAGTAPEYPARDPSASWETAR